MDQPEPGPVRVRAEVIGANFVDTKFRQGAGTIFTRPLAGAPTGDVVGVVDAVGPEVDNELLGQRVATLAEEAFADYVVADAQWVAPVPDGLDDGAASMLALAAPVAAGVLRTGGFAAGATVLVHAAAGGIGHLAVQPAKLLGAGRVIATAGSPDKLDFARSQGADVAVDYSTEDWPEHVREAAPDGVDIVLDSIGGQTLHRSLELLAPLGRVVIYGAASGELAQVPVTGLFRLQSVAGFSTLAWREARPREAIADMVELTEYFATGRLHATVHTRLPLTEAAEAHRILEARTHLGRVLLVS